MTLTLKAVPAAIRSLRRALHAPLVSMTVLACASGLSWAQGTGTPAAKPAARPAPASTAPAAAPAGARTLSGNSGANTAVLTRDELRACLNRRDGFSTRLNAIEAARTELDTEREAIAAEQAALKVERESMGGVKGDVDAMNVRMKAFQADVEAWNKRVAEFNEVKPAGSAADRQRTEINAQGEELRKRQAALQAEREALLARGEAAVKAFNVKAGALDQRVQAWNARNAQVNADGDKIKTDREAWTAECGDRRYREDDEKAILGGK